MQFTIGPAGLAPNFEREHQLLVRYRPDRSRDPPCTVARNVQGKPKPTSSAGTFRVLTTKWELYNIDEDFSRADDLAEQMPEKLRGRLSQPAAFTARPTAISETGIGTQAGRVH